MSSQPRSSKNALKRRLRKVKFIELVEDVQKLNFPLITFGGGHSVVVFWGKSFRPLRHVSWPAKIIDRSTAATPSN